MLGAAGAALAATAALVGLATAASTPLDLTAVSTTNPRVAGNSAPNILSPELRESIVAQGSMPVENPILDSRVGFYGYDADGHTLLPLPDATAPFEARKTEPDKNTYLVFDNGLKGADPNYDYGTHFLFQGHEAGTPGYVTRINLDADGAHRVTVLATKEAGPGGPNTGADLQDFDGSTWDPWAQRLLFTAETGTNGGVWQGTLDVPSSVENLQAFIGRGGFEGIQNDNRGNLYVVEDSGASADSAKFRRPNSFVYRFLPQDPSDLTKGGAIQALQVLRNGSPITFQDGATFDAADYVALHQNGTSFKTKWLTIETTTSTSTLPGPDDNALAKSEGATPFKRPENGLFRPGSKFTEFYFDETGDTNALSPANNVSGGYGSIFKLTQSPTSDDGTLTLFFHADQAHAAFDNLAFFTSDVIGFVQDAGETLHGQANRFDSGFLFDVRLDYSKPDNVPLRFLALGRDASATIDASLLGTAGFQNDGDNEITGIHVSDGDPSKEGILGALPPHAFQGNEKWRVFYTQQHGDNMTYEITR